MRNLLGKYRVSAQEELTGPILGIDCSSALVLAASWESRCTDILERVDLRDFCAIAVIRFQNHGRTGKALESRKQISAATRRLSTKVQHFDLDSTGSEYNSVHHLASELISFLQRSARDVVVDISSLPRKLLAPFVFANDRYNVFRRTIFHYTRPRYVGVNYAGGGGGLNFTDGKWRLADSPFFEQPFSRGLRQGNIISAGLEYGPIRDILRALDGDQNHVTISHPGVSLEYTAMADDMAKLLRSAFDLDERYLHRVSHSDFLGMINLLSEVTSAMKMQGRDVTLITTGGKIHALATMYAALAGPRVNFRLRAPGAYRERDINGYGAYDIISVENIYRPL